MNLVKKGPSIDFVACATNRLRGFGCRGQRLLFSCGSYFVRACGTLPDVLSI